MSVELSELKVKIADLKVGMYVCRLDKPWEETSFLLQGFLITSQEDIDALAKQCRYVYVETRTFATKATEGERRIAQMGLSARKSTLDVTPTLPPLKVPEIPDLKHRKSYTNTCTVEQEFSQARLCFKYAKSAVQSIIDGVRLNRNIDMDECREVVNDVIDSIFRNHNALIWLTRIKNKDDYTAEHSINVCILSIAFAKFLGLDEKHIENIGLCGMLHDVGKAKIPDEILNKPGRFTDEEMEIMKLHTTFGRDLLMSVPDHDMNVIDVAYCHHERMDGNGYPIGLEPSKIPYYAQLISIADAYDAITSSRIYDSARSSMNALDIIYKNRNLQFNEQLALEFVRFIGVYPPGSIVEMSNGEIGIVISSSLEHKLRPRVLLLRRSDKKTVQKTIIQLEQRPKDCDGNLYNIAKEIPNGTYGIDIGDFLHKNLKLDQET
ncbi:HD-GYP domain-containing protein [Pleionea sediminis]|uniref:HD-GYP domain-containing protein n=1 Tax=Pleionea sediminis TaxID=2569479 RepID=UPI00118657B5|nr:HD-GYP domain-containing protein [Pleionea sediminis]